MYIIMFLQIFLYLRRLAQIRTFYRESRIRLTVKIAHDRITCIFTARHLMVDFQVVVRTSYQYYKTRMFLAHTVKPDEKTKSETERNKTQKQEEKVLQHEQGGYIRILSYRKDQTAQEDKQEHILEHTFPYLKGMHFPPVKHYS